MSACCIARCRGGCPACRSRRGPAPAGCRTVGLHGKRGERVDAWSKRAGRGDSESPCSRQGGEGESTDQTNRQLYLLRESTGAWRHGDTGRGNKPVASQSILCVQMTEVSHSHVRRATLAQYSPNTRLHAHEHLNRSIRGPFINPVHACT